MNKIVLLLILTALPYSTGTPGQLSPDCVTLGTTKLRLGMGQADVLEELGMYYSLDELGHSARSVWLVLPKDRSAYPVGSISFKQGKLDSVLKYWGSGGPDTQAGFTTALYAAVSSFEREGNTACTISAGSLENPESEERTVFISCSKKYLRIGVFKHGQNPQSASVIEVLEPPKTN